jgi:hypothetical protein
VSAVRDLKFVVRNNEEEEKVLRLSSDGLRRTLCERVDRIFVGRDFCDGARSQPFSRRLFDQVERGDSSEGDDD